MRDSITNPKVPPGRFKIRNIGIVAYPGVQILDITGPMEVFSFANFGLKELRLSNEEVYPIRIIAEKTGPITTMSGVQIVADTSFSELNNRIDTLVVPGGSNIDEIMENKPLVDWVRSMPPHVRRLVSVCTGAFILAEGGLLDGRQATTHWRFCDRLAREYPEVSVNPDKIFVRNDFIATSGGITSGIDLTLALIEEDWGRELALSVARYLVVFLKRPGGQSQFSMYLTNEAVDRHDIRELQSWIVENPAEDLRIDAMAQRVSMSPRNFSRIFLAETGITAAKYVERVRIDAARYYLVNTTMPIAQVMEKSGFKDSETMRRAFIRNLGVNPQNYRAYFSGSEYDPSSIKDPAAT